MTCAHSSNAASTDKGDASQHHRIKNELQSNDVSGMSVHIMDAHYGDRTRGELLPQCWLTSLSFPGDDCHAMQMSAVSQSEQQV